MMQYMAQNVMHYMMQYVTNHMHELSNAGLSCVAQRQWVVTSHKEAGLCAKQNTKALLLESKSTKCLMSAPLQEEIFHKSRELCTSVDAYLGSVSGQIV